MIGEGPGGQTSVRPPSILPGSAGEAGQGGDNGDQFGRLDRLGDVALEPGP
jgi:hypothetical protein